MYADVDEILWPAAELSVRAQLAYLRRGSDKSRVRGWNGRAHDGPSACRTSTIGAIRTAMVPLALRRGPVPAAPDTRLHDCVMGHGATYAEPGVDLRRRVLGAHSAGTSTRARRSRSVDLASARTRQAPPTLEADPGHVRRPDRGRRLGGRLRLPAARHCSTRDRASPSESIVGARHELGTTVGRARRTPRTSTTALSTCRHRSRHGRCWHPDWIVVFDVYRSVQHTPGVAAAGLRAEWTRSGDSRAPGRVELRIKLYATFGTPRTGGGVRPRYRRSWARRLSRVRGIGPSGEEIDTSHRVLRLWWARTVLRAAQRPARIDRSRTRHRSPKRRRVPSSASDCAG